MEMSEADVEEVKNDSAIPVENNPLRVTIESPIEKDHSKAGASSEVEFFGASLFRVAAER
jgi:hypothetical protein